MPYKVSATISGRRVLSDSYHTKTEAQAYADRTNRDRKGANARVKKVA